MKILITGATGFISTYIREKIGYSYKNFDILYATSSVNDKRFIKCASLYKDIKEKLYDINIDIIIHCASIIPKSFDDASYELFLENTEMMKNLYEFALIKKVKKFIYISGFGSMRNPNFLDIGDYYTMSKIVGEHFCAMLNRKGVNSVCLRISAPYGEYSRHKNVINIFVEKALKGEDILIWGSGKREQNFTYVGDVMNAILLAIEKEVSGTYSIIGRENISMINLARLIVELTNSKSRIVFSGISDPQEDYRPNYDITTAKKILGYDPKYTLKEGLLNYIHWYKKVFISQK